MSLTRKDVHVELTLTEGSVLKGTMVIERTSRLSDTLNKRDKDFIVLTDYEENHHMINKRNIIKVVEIEHLELEE
jgi:hypothetical protein